MGEKKMLQKERKSPSQKKKAVAPSKPKSRSHFYWWNLWSCSSIVGYADKSYTTKCLLRDSKSGLGGITKSWISPSSSCCIHQTWPQLVEINKTRGFYVYSGTERKQKNIVIEPFCGDDRYSEFAEFTNFIKFQGKCYAISLQGSLALVEDSSPHREIMAFGKHRVVPFCKESRHFREHLLEYNEDIYLVFLLSRESINLVDGVEVYGLDKSRLLWEKVDRLKGDAMFFLQDNCCVGISASLLGCSSKGSNRVYFTHDRADDDSWFVYDMETSCISPTFGPELDLIR